MEIGEKLKEARLEKDLSLDSVQETTKIQKRYLMAIEEGNFHILPGKFYARAFIKEYAAAVGLDPNELLEEYKEEIPQTEEESTAQYTRIQRSRKENTSTKNPAVFSFLPTIIVVVLVIGIVFAAWYFYKEAISKDSAGPVDKPDDNEIIYEPDDNKQDEKTADDNTADDSADEEHSDNTKDESNTPKPKLTVVEKGTGASPESTLELENAGDEIKITLESDGNTYLGMENGDGKSYYAQELSADNSPQEFDVSDDERIYLNIGKAPDLKITINGVELEYPVDPQENVHQKLWINLSPSE
ncbi:helix-turn-helix domain-containing protein [Virgibacillus dakarensis]|uniref:helix-turn-helix domain-containing protein n=1 Tax=Virgibacillus dakarensis TaxID=1917889 RepID=UPI000B43E4BE|nr:helix-turn-helix domain-containing protein [Virgibacillus dakarensis]MBT2215042.1 helix-turn-helix domain-containing protein [Virgibacillus dakarensis]